MPTFSTHTVPSSVIGACNDAPDLQASGGLKSESHNHSSSEESGEATDSPNSSQTSFSWLISPACCCYYQSVLALPSGQESVSARCTQTDDTVFHLENTSWSVPGANSDITPAGNKHGWMANLALSLSSRIFYSGIKLTSDNDKT